MRAAFPLLFFLIAMAGCDRLVTPRHAQQLKDAQAKTAASDFPRAISLYESALEDRPSDADVHYQLALLYDDKMGNPLSALHHFRRYLEIAPSGSHTAEVKGFIKRDEVALQTSLSGDAIISRAEATRLRNENLNLHRELDEAHGRLRAPAEEGKKPTKIDKAGSQSYVVQRGDTLASISRKFYKTSAHWKQILDANRDTIDNPKKLSPGMNLTIPRK